MDKKKFAERAAIYFRRCGGVLMYFENIEAGSLFAIRLTTDFNTIVVFQIDSNEPIEYKNILKHVDKNLKSEKDTNLILEQTGSAELLLDDNGKKYWRILDNSSKDSYDLNPGDALLLNPGAFQTGTKINILELTS